MGELRLLASLRPLESERDHAVGTDAVFRPFFLFVQCVQAQTPPSTCEEAWSRPLGRFRGGRGEGGVAVSPVSAGETGLGGGGGMVPEDKNISHPRGQTSAQKEDQSFKSHKSQMELLALKVKSKS